MYCKHYKVSGYMASYVIDLTGKSLEEVVHYLTDFSNVHIFYLGDRPYLNATSVHGSVHARF